MTQFEIIMRTDKPELPAEIGNFTEVKAAISEALTQYQTDVVITSDSVKDAEKTRAHLRKVKEQIEAYRNDAKAAYLDKFTKLETQCKELSGLIEQPITAIDSKIKDYEEAVNSEKLTELLLFFGSINHPEWLELQYILNPKWKNKGMTIDKLKNEIATAVCELTDAYTELQNLYEKSPLWTAINDKFMECRDKSKTLVYATQLERQHSEEQKRAESIQNARRAQEEQHAAVTPETAQNAPETAANASETVLRGKFEVECEKSKLIALVQFMKENGIKYSVVKE